MTAKGDNEAVAEVGVKPVTDEIDEVAYLHLVPKPDNGRWWPLVNFQIQIASPKQTYTKDGGSFIEPGNERQLARFADGIYRTRSRKVRDILESKKEYFVREGGRVSDATRSYRRLTKDDLVLVDRIREKGSTGKYLYAELMEKLEAKRVYDA